MSEPKFINIEPDGLLITAWNITQSLVREGVFAPDDEHTEGWLTAYLHGALVTNSDLIKRSSWIKESE